MRVLHCLSLSLCFAVFPGCESTAPFNRHPTDDMQARLVWATNNSELQEARELIYRGAWYRTQKDLDQALWLAIIGDDLPLAKVTIDAGADPKRRTYRDTTLLFDATQHGMPEMIRLLVEKGARDDWAMLIETANEWEHTDAVEELKRLRDAHRP